MRLVDTLRVRGHLRVEKFDAEGTLYETAEAENIFLTAGINEIWRLVIGQSANTFSAAQAQVGIGDSSKATDAAQTDLQAATNKAYRPMVSGYPMPTGGNAVQFQASFGSLDANFAWAEFVVKHGSSGICIDRGVAAMGTKAPGTTWTATVTLSIA